MINKFLVEEACDVIFPLKLSKLTCRNMEDATCISSNLVKLSFGFYPARPNFDNKEIIHSLFDPHAKFLHVPNVEDFWEDCADELEERRRESSRFSIAHIPIEIGYRYHKYRIR